MNGLDYYALLLDEEGKVLAREQQGRRAFLEMGMDRATHETWMLLRGKATPDMAMFALPDGAGVKDSCLRAMVGRLADGKNLFVNASGDRVMVNVYSPNFVQLLDEIDLWLSTSNTSSVNMVYRRFVSSHNDLFIWVTLGELPEEEAFKQDVWNTLGATGHVRLNGPAAAYDIEVRFAYESRTGWTDAALVFTAMYHKFLTDGFYSIETLEIERGKIEQEIVNEFCGRTVGYVYDEVGSIDRFTEAFFNKSLTAYIQDLADFDFEWELGKHLPEVNALDPLFDGGQRMSVNPGDDEDVAARAKEIAAAVVDLYNKHWSGEISLPAYDQPRLGLGVQDE